MLAFWPHVIVNNKECITVRIQNIVKRVHTINTIITLFKITTVIYLPICVLCQQLRIATVF